MQNKQRILVNCETSKFRKHLQFESVFCFCKGHERNTEL